MADTLGYVVCFALGAITIALVFVALRSAGVVSLQQQESKPNYMVAPQSITGRLQGAK